MAWMNIKTTSIALVAIILAVSIGVLFSLNLISRNASVIDYDWTEYETMSSPKVVGLDMLVSELGFGGMIHQFKNYVLRQDEPRLARIRGQIGSARSALRVYESGGVTAAEAAAIADIRDTIDLYEDALRMAHEMTLAQATPEEVDATVKIDDGPAIDAINTLFAAIDAESRRAPGDYTKGQTLVQLRRYLGFGGMIHHFKNYVLRQDAPRVERINATLARAKQVVDAYASFPLTPEERRALDDIVGVITAYADNTVVVTDLIAGNPTAAEIDAVVKIDDGPALAGFDTLVAQLTAETKAMQAELTRSIDTVMATASTMFLIVLVILPVAAGLLAWLLLYRIVRPINTLSGAMQVLAGGETEVEVPSTGRKDEIGMMARTVQVFRENMIRNAAMEREARDKDVKMVERRRAEMAELAESFETGVGAIVSEVLDAAERLNESSANMSSTAVSAAGEVEQVTAAADQASNSVHMVAAAAEELSTTIAEVSQKTATTSTLSVSAAEDAAETSNAVRRLNEVVSKVAAVTSLIQDIAEQTNLLALNATIESARAGEAGRGFAVVASEVKQLAQQTSKATDEIRAQIEEIQTASDTSVAAVDKIAAMVREISANAQLITEASEQQETATREIAQSATTASGGTTQVSQGLGRVGDAAKVTGEASGTVKSAAESLSVLAHDLRDRIAAFVTEIRAA